MSGRIDVRDFREEHLALFGAFFLLVYFFADIFKRQILFAFRFNTKKSKNHLKFRFWF